MRLVARLSALLQSAHRAYIPVQMSCERSKLPPKDDANRKLSTYGDGHKLVKVQNGLVDRVAARPRLEAFMEYLSSKGVR